MHLIRKEHIKKVRNYTLACAIFFFCFFSQIKHVKAAEVFSQPDASYATTTYQRYDFTALSSGLLTNVWVNTNFGYPNSSFAADVIIARASDNQQFSVCSMSTQNKNDIRQTNVLAWINIEGCYNYNPLVAGTAYYAFLSYGGYVGGLVTSNLSGTRSSDRAISVFGYNNNEPAPIPNTTTRIQAVSPINLATSSTSTVLTAKFYINSQTNNTPASTPTRVKINLWNTVFVQQIKTIYLDIPAATDSEITIATTTILQNNQRYNWSVALVANTAPDNFFCNLALINGLCNWIDANENTVAIDDSGNEFVVGTNPTGSISDFTNSFFNSVEVQNNRPSLMGQCTLVATSSCDAGNPSTYQGCLINGLIATFCPSGDVITYATTSIIGSIQNKIPFGFFYAVNQKISIAGSSTPNEGSDVTVDIPAIGGEQTLFSWQAAHDFMYDTIGEDGVTIILYSLWILSSVLMIAIIFKIFK